MFVGTRITEAGRANLLVLTGGAEFQKGQETTDRYTLEQAGGGPVVIVAAELERAAQGRKWWEQLGAREVQSELIEAVSGMSAPVHTARLIYLAEGEAGRYVEAEALWRNIAAAQQNGAILAGAGGGAMALGAQIYDPATGRLAAGRSQLPQAIVVPHFNSFGRKWAAKILELDEAARPPYLLGLDEKVAVIGQGNDWQVYGRGWITLYRQGRPAKYQGGQPFKLEV